MFIFTTIAPTPSAQYYLDSIDQHEEDEPFRTFGKGVVTVLVRALESIGRPVTKDQLLMAIRNQGHNIPDDQLEPEVIEALGQIKLHDKIHFQLAIISSVVAINTLCNT